MKSQEAYLRGILKCVERIEAYTQNGQDEFVQSNLIQDAVIRNFEVIGEIVKRLSPELLNKTSHIPWRQIAGFRDVLIHDYDEIDLESVWNTRQHYMPPLKEAVIELLANLDE